MFINLKPRGKKSIDPTKEGNATLKNKRGAVNKREQKKNEIP